METFYPFQDILEQFTLHLQLNSSGNTLLELFFLLLSFYPSLVMVLLRNFSFALLLRSFLSLFLLHLLKLGFDFPYLLSQSLDEFLIFYIEIF